VDSNLLNWFSSYLQVSGEIHRPAACGWQALHLYTFVYVCTMPSMAPVNTTCPIEIMYTCLMRQYRDFLKGVQSTHCPCSYTFLIVGVLLNILGENQIDIHKLTCFFVDG
jgi:hypothetical protein